MPTLPRLVLASLLEHEEPSACTLALMSALRARDLHVQHFRSLAAFTPIDYVTPLTGIASRHLDPWIMSAPLCRELFRRSAAHADISIVEGTAIGAHEIAQTLNAPVVGVFRSQPDGIFHANRRASGFDALLVDGFASGANYESQKRALQEMYGVPVLGGLAEGRLAADCFDRLQRGRRVTGGILDELARRLLQVTDLDGILELARSRPLPSESAGLFSRPASCRLLRVAVAYDDCFHCYFPDTLDALEFLGAEISEFSPLIDERLPEGTDIVYLGCGHPERFARALCDNECIVAALRGHVCSGQRIYAEGGGMAYLCQQMKLPDGVLFPSVGVFPAQAEFAGQPMVRPQPVTLTCRRGNWIAAQNEQIRGYRNGAWRLTARPGLVRCFDSDAAAPEAVIRHHCIGSTVHLNFAAQPRVLDAFFAPHSPSLSISDSATP